MSNVIGASAGRRRQCRRELGTPCAPQAERVHGGHGVLPSHLGRHGDSGISVGSQASPAPPIGTRNKKAALAPTRWTDRNTSSRRKGDTTEVLLGALINGCGSAACPASPMYCCKSACADFRKSWGPVQCNESSTNYTRTSSMICSRSTPPKTRRGARWVKMASRCRSQRDREGPLTPSNATETPLRAKSAQGTYKRSGIMYCGMVFWGGKSSGKDQVISLWLCFPSCGPPMTQWRLSTIPKAYLSGRNLPTPAKLGARCSRLWPGFAWCAPFYCG